MSIFVEIGLCLTIWSCLAGIGVYRGIQGTVIIFTSWTDLVFSFVMLLCLAVIAIATWSQAQGYQAALMLSGAVLAPWLYTTSRTNRHLSDLLVTVPAKVTLISLALFFSILAIESITKTLSPKTENRNRLISGIIGAATGAIAWKLFRLIQRFVAAGKRRDTFPRNSNNSVQA